MDFQDIAYTFLEHAKRLISSTFGFVGYIDVKTGYLFNVTMTRDIWDQCKVSNKTIVFKKFGGIWVWVLKNRKPVITNSLEDDPRSSGSPDGHVPIKKFLSFPAMIGDRLLGQFALANPDKDYTEEDLNIAQRLSYIYALAIERKQSEESLRESEKRYRTLVHNVNEYIYRLEYKDNKLCLLQTSGIFV